MSRNLPAPTAGSAPARVVHYVDPAPNHDALLALANPLAYQRELARRRHEQSVLYGRWLLRQQEIAASDRKVRRFFLGFGAVAALAVVAGLATAGWFVYRAAADIPLGVLAVPIVLGLVVAAGVGHKCVTIIQHWH
jgi:hypothetical protein